jgi:FHA domain-containing protein
MIKISVISYNNEAPAVPLSALFGPDGASIGRGNDNFLVLQDPKRYVSRLQASVKSDGVSHAIVNLSQANPILVNGEEIAMGQDVALKFGDEIQIGLYLLKAESPVAQQQGVAPAIPAPENMLATAAFPVIPKAQTPAHADPAPLDLNGLGSSNDDPFADLLGGAVNVAATPAAAPARVAAPAAPVAPPPVVATPAAPTVTNVAPASASDPLGIDALLGVPSGPAATTPAAPMATSGNADPFSFDDLLGTPAPAAQTAHAAPAAPHATQAPQVGHVDPFNFDDLLGGAQPAPHAASAQLPTVHDNPFGFDDLLSSPSHNSLSTNNEPRAQLIPDDFDPFALPSAAPRNTLDPLAGLSNNEVSLEGLAGQSTSIDGLMSAPGHSGPSLLDPVALGPTASSETDPLALFASESLLPTRKEEAFFGDVASNHVSELSAHFTLPQARQEILPEHINDSLLPRNDLAAPILVAEVTPPQAFPDPIPQVVTPVEPAPVAPPVAEPTPINAPATQVVATPDIAPTAPIAPPKQAMSLVAEALQAKPLPKLQPADSHRPAATSPAVPAGTSAATPQTATARPQTTEKPAAGSQMLDAHALAEAFMRGANLPLDTMPSGITLEWMETLGRIVATATDGTVELIASRALVKREVKADLTMIVVRNNNPLKFLPDGQSALIQMLGRKIPGFMEPIEAMQDAYIDLRAHQIGVVAGMRAALDEVLRRFDPEMLEKKLKTRTLLDSLVAANRKAKMWDLYAELFKDIYIEAQDDFQTLFGKAFLSAYEAEIARFRQESPT